MPTDYFSNHSKFAPTSPMQKVLDGLEETGLGAYAPEVAAGVMAYFVAGSDLDRFVTALVGDGFTYEGLVALAKTALDKLAEGHA